VIGLTVVNGSATTFLRSDGAPLLSQAIAPTWTAQHIFASDGTAGNANWAIKINSALPVTGWAQTGGATDGKIWADFITGGTRTFAIFTDAIAGEKDWLAVARTADVVTSIILGNTTDLPTTTINGAVTVFNSVSNAARITVKGSGTTGGNFTGFQLLDGSSAFRGGFFADEATNVISIFGPTVALCNLSTTAITGFGPVASAMVNMTPDASTFTGTLTGMTTTVTNTCVWSRQGNQVTLYFGTGTGIGNVGSLTMTGIPAAIQPARAQSMTIPSFCMNDVGVVGTNNYGVTISAGTATFFVNGSSSTWTAASAKGISVAFTVTYLIN
jgi:hypothetical protein